MNIFDTLDGTWRSFFRIGNKKESTSKIGPYNDNTASFLITDSNGNKIVNVDTLNKQVGIGTIPNSTFEVDGSIGEKVTTITTNTTLDNTHNIIVCNPTGDILITLPNPTLITNRKYIIKNISKYVITIDAGVSYLIDSNRYYIFNNNIRNICIISNGVNWVSIILDDTLKLDQTIQQSISGIPITDGLQYATDYVETESELTGTNFWDSANNCVTTILSNGVRLQNGQELYFNVENKTGDTLPNGKVASYVGTVGASGKLKASLGIADGTIPAIYNIGIFTQDIANNASGKVTQFGVVRGIDTTGTPYGETWEAENILYVSATTPGALTNIMPEAPKFAIPFAVVVHVSATVGTIFMRPTYPCKMTELSDVDGTPLTVDGQVAVWDNTRGVFDFTRNIENFKKYNGIVRSLTYACFPATKEITTNSFTLEAGTENVTYYYRGTRVIVTTDKTATLDDGADGSTAGIYYVYFNGSTGNILATKTFPGLDCDSNPLIAMIKWNGTDYGAILDERHAFDRDCEWHKWSHETVGARYKSGLDLTITGTNHTATFSVSTGILYDEDIKFIIPETTTMRILARTGATSYEIITQYSTVPFSYGANNRPNYVRLDTYALTEVASANNRFINFFVYGTNDIKTGIYGFIEEFATTTTGHTSVAAARAIGFPNLTGFNLAPEIRPLYRIIIRANTQIQPLTASDDYRTVTSLPQGAGTVSLSAANTSFNSYEDITGTNVQTAVEQVYDFYKVGTYDSTDIPALQAGQEVDYVIDEFDNTYRYKVLTDTSALETPYTNPEKFLRISPHRSQFELKSLYRFASDAIPTYNSITYTYNEVTYIAIAAFSATVGSILIYNYDTGIQVQAIALNNAKYLHYNTDNDKLYVTTNSNTIACYDPTGTLVGSYDIDNTVTLTGISNIESVGISQIAMYAWDSATQNTHVYHVTLNADGTFATTIKQTKNTGNNTDYSRCKYVASNNRLYCCTKALGSVAGARNQGYYMNLAILGGAFVNTIVTVTLTNWESGTPNQMYSDVENVGNYLYLNCSYGVIRTDLDLANGKAILLGSTSNRFLDDVDTGRMKYIAGLDKLVVARYPKITTIRGVEPMFIYQLDISELEGFTTTPNAARNVYISEFKATTGNVAYDVNLAGIDEINHHIIVATKDVHVIKFYKY